MVAGAPARRPGTASWLRLSGHHMVGRAPARRPGTSLVVAVVRPPHGPPGAGPQAGTALWLRLSGTTWSAGRRAAGRVRPSGARTSAGEDGTWVDPYGKGSARTSRGAVPQDACGDRRHSG